MRQFDVHHSRRDGSPEGPPCGNSMSMTAGEPCRLSGARSACRNTCRCFKHKQTPLAHLTHNHCASARLTDQHFVNVQASTAIPIHNHASTTKTGRQVALGARARWPSTIRSQASDPIPSLFLPHVWASDPRDMFARSEAESLRIRPQFGRFPKWVAWGHNLADSGPSLVDAG